MVGPASLALGLVVAAAGMPPNPRREAPPPGLEAHATKVGDVAPAFSLPDAQGVIVDSAKERAHGPIAIVFYRGFW